MSPRFSKIGSIVMLPAMVLIFWPSLYILPSSLPGMVTFAEIRESLLGTVIVALGQFTTTSYSVLAVAGMGMEYSGTLGSVERIASVLRSGRRFSATNLFDLPFSGVKGAQSRSKISSEMESNLLFPNSWVV